MVENDEYYISKLQIENCNEIDEFWFKYNDLIQVNGICGRYTYQGKRKHQKGSKK